MLFCRAVFCVCIFFVALFDLYDPTHELRALRRWSLFSEFVSDVALVRERSFPAVPHLGH